MLIRRHSFISGKIYQPEQATSHQRAENLSFFSAQYVHRNSYSEKLYSLKKTDFVSRYWNTISSHGLHPSTVLGESKKFRARGICRCFVSLPSESCNWIKPVHLKDISISNRQSLQPRHNRTRAGYKSEEYDVTGTDLDSFVSSEGEAVLVGETKPWWEQFPKRWVIVLLCFSAFLLCNMDRVSCFLLFSFIPFFSHLKLFMLYLHYKYSKLCSLLLFQFVFINITAYVYNISGEYEHSNTAHVKGV